MNICYIWTSFISFTSFGNICAPFAALGGVASVHCFIARSVLILKPLSDQKAPGSPKTTVSYNVNIRGPTAIERWHFDILRWDFDFLDRRITCVIWETFPADTQNLKAKSSTNKPSLSLIRTCRNSCPSVNFLAGPDFSKGIKSSEILIRGDASRLSVYWTIVVFFKFHLWEAFWIKDCWQISFLMLNRFCQLSKPSTPTPYS